MALNSASGKQLIEYTVDDTYNALISALKKDRLFSLTESNPITRTITLKTRVTWRSWGENLLITISPAANNMTEIYILSTLKFGLVDWWKNHDNVKRVLNILFDELKNYNE